MVRRGRFAAAVVVACALLAPGSLPVGVGGPRPAAAAPGEPVVVPCTVEHYQAALDQFGATVTDASSNNLDTLDVVATAMLIGRCNSFTGGIIPDFGNGGVVTNPGQVLGSGTVAVDTQGALPVVGEAGDIALRLGGAWRAIDVPAVEPAPEAPEDAFGGVPVTAPPYLATFRPGGWDNNSSTAPLVVLDRATNTLRQIATMSTGYPCFRDDPVRAVEDVCTQRIRSWGTDAAALLAANENTAIVFVPWIWTGGRSIVRAACFQTPFQLCEGYGPTQWAAVPIYVSSTVEPPTVGIDWSAAGSPGAFSFSGNASIGAPATITRYDWNFGDGDVRPNGGPLQTKTWVGEAASRTVTLTVTASNGSTATATATLRPELAIRLAPGDVPSVRVGDTATMKVTVANDGPSTISGVVPTVLLGPADVAARSYAITPGSATLAPGTTQTFTVPFLALGEGTASGTLDASGTSLGATVTAPSHPYSFVIGNPGLLIDLQGSIAEVGRSFVVTMTIENPGVDPVTDIRWAEPATGIRIESGDDPAAAEPAITFVNGPDQALPTTLGPREVRGVRYVFNAPFLGASVVTAEATGTTAADVPVSGRQVMSVTVLAAWSEAVRDQMVVDGIEKALTAQAEGMAAFDRDLGAQITVRFGWPAPTAAQVASLQQAGLRHPGFNGTLANAFQSGLAQGRALLNGWADGLALAMDRFGVAGGQQLANLYATIEDPVQRRQVATAIVAVAKQLPADALVNAGYLGQAMAATATIEGLQTIATENAKVARVVASAMGDAYVGTGPLVEQYAQQYRTDPVGAMGELGRFSGDVTWTGSEAAMTGVLGEAGLRAVALARTSPLVQGALSNFRKGGTIVGDEAAALAGAAGAAGENAAEAMVVRLGQAQKVMDNFQALGEGTLLDGATLVGKGGILPEDAAAIQDTIRRANAKFGIELEVATRTSEPLSSAITGVAKPEFVKPKAVSLLDIMMGADPARAGRVGLFEPIPLDAAVVARLDAAEPGFAAKYAERLASQKKLWLEWQDPSSKLRVLTEAGERYRSTGGITILNDRPGNLLPYGLKYLEQLDEAAFLAAKGIDPADVPAIKARVLASNIDRIKAAPIATVGPNGTTFIDEAISGRSFVSDLDIQSIAPRNGVWPSGVNRGQVETYFKAELSKLKRYPFHGWSDTAVDLPSDFYLAAVPFQLGNAHPAMAFEAANRVAGRLQLLERLARDKAAKLLAAGDQAGYAKIVAPYDKLADLKDEATGLYSPTKLLKKYPPGEKTINFTAGDIRVGYGTGGR